MQARTQVARWVRAMARRTDRAGSSDRMRSITDSAPIVFVRPIPAAFEGRRSTLNGKIEFDCRSRVSTVAGSPAQADFASRVARGYQVRRPKGVIAMSSVGSAGSWLEENGPKELELLFRDVDRNRSRACHARVLQRHVP